jgi:hypothetical protein
MPGFGKRMEDDQVPEWSTEYVPYKAMMKQLDKLVARMAAEEQDRHLQENVATTGGGAPKPTLRGVANAPAAEASIGIGMASGENAAVKRTGLIDVAATDSGANAAAGGVNLTTRTTIVGGTTAAGDEVLALGEEKKFFEQLDESLKRVVTFYSARVDIMRGAAARNTGQVSHLKSEALRVVKMPKGADDDDAGGDLKRALTDVASSFKRKMGGKKKVDPRKAALQKAGDDARMLRKAIEESYRAINMLESYVSLNMEAFSKIVKKHDKMTGWQTQDSYMRGLKELRVFHDDEVQNLRGTMESAYLKVEEVICVLEPDRWNRVVRGKRTGRKSAAKSGPLGFYEVRRRRNELLAKLRNETKEVGSRPSSLGPRFQAGLALGIAFALGAMLVTRVSEACGGSGYDTLKCDAMAAVAPAVRAPFLIALHVALYGVATQAWIETKVNAPFIFQARRGTELSPTGAVLAGSLAASVWCVVSMVLMYAAEREATHTGGVYPTDGSGTVGDMRANHLGNVFVGALVAMIAMFFMFFSPWPHAVIRNRRYPELQKAIQPLQHPPDSTRRFFLNALMRAAQAPFRKIRMVDFFLADQFVSQTKAMTDILVVFFLACNWTSAVKYASIISLWPNWCRFTQVLRRYRDNTAQWIHLVNAGKYATGLTAGIAGLCLKYAESRNHGMGGAIVDNMSALRVWYNTMSYAGILYGAAWDFFQDWSVFRLVKKENGWYKLEFFKRRMMCKRVELYYFAVVFNSVLRNKWIYASLSAVQDRYHGRGRGLGDDLVRRRGHPPMFLELLPRGERARDELRYVPSDAGRPFALRRRRPDGRGGGRRGGANEETRAGETEGSRGFPRRREDRGAVAFARWIRRRRQRQRRRPPDGLPQHADVQVPIRPRPKRRARRRRGRHLRTIRTLERVGVEVEVQIDRAQARRRRRRGRRIRIRIAAKEERRGRGNRQDDLAQK